MFRHVGAVTPTAIAIVDGEGRRRDGGGVVRTLAAGPVQDALSDVAHIVPTFVGFLVILLIGWLVARVLRTGAGRLLQRVGFDRLAERSGVGKALAGGRYTPSVLLATIVYYAIVLFTLQLAFGL